MKLQRNIFKWIAVAIVLATLLGFAIALPSASAQEENPLTPTPGEQPLQTPEPLQVPEIQQQAEPQTLREASADSNLAEEWSLQAGISLETQNASEPKLAIDANGIKHFVWSQQTLEGANEIYYSRVFPVPSSENGELTQSIPVNVSNSPSLPSSIPQIVVDNAGIAHIVWQDKDGTDHYEVFYSHCDQAGCTAPAILSEGTQCGSQPGDWKAFEPTIGIDGNGNLMVVWMSYEPLGYQGKIYPMFSAWSASGQPPSNRTGCHPSSGLYVHPTVSADSSGNFHLTMMSYSYEIFYSSYASGSWSSNQNIGSNGWAPELYVDQSNKIHVAWLDMSGLPFYRFTEGGASSWSPTETIYITNGCRIFLEAGLIDRDLSLITDENGLPKIICASDHIIINRIYEFSRQLEGWTEAKPITWKNMTKQPSLAKDADGNLHLVWTDFRTGNSTIFYSPSTYNCEGITPTTDAGQAVLNELQNYQPFDDFKRLNYCKNKVEEVIFVPAPGDPEDPQKNPAENPKEAFKQWAELIKSAKHEVAFTTMVWDRGGPGKAIAEGIKFLQGKVETSPSSDYPHGMTVRILLGEQFYWLSDPSRDQRYNVLDDLKTEGVSLYETLPDGRIWKVEVGVCECGWGVLTAPPSIFSSGIYSHVKLMVVDNSKMIVSGYMPMNAFLTYNTTDNIYDPIDTSRDLGLKVSGPVAGNAMAVFDALWDGSNIKCTKDDDIEYISDWGTCANTEGVNPPHWLYTPFEHDNDIVFPLYRDNNQKGADRAVQAAIESASTRVYVLQDRVAVPWTPPGLPTEPLEPLLPYADGLLKEALENSEVHILFNGVGISRGINNHSAFAFMNRYYLMGGNPAKNIGDIFKFFAPNGIGHPLHAKSFIVDGNFFVIGSQNFDESSFGDNNLDLDLVEYSLGVEDNNNHDIVEGFTSYYNSLWDETPNNIALFEDSESLVAGIQQANAGDTVIAAPGVYEFADTVAIPEGVTLAGFGVTFMPAENFSGQSLLRINGSNVTLMEMTIQDSPGYGIEIGDGNISFENINLSRIVFANNALGGVHVLGPVSGAAGYTIENNTFAGGGSGVTITAGASTTGIIRDNIFAGQTIAPIQIASADDGSVEYAYNLFYNCAGGSCASGWHTGDLGAASSEHDSLFDLDPLFVNPSAGDYQLSPASPAIDSGDPAILHEMVYDGNGDDQPRIDLGAFEYLDTSAFTPPAVQSVTRASANPASASSVDFTVTFSEAVTGVDSSDFTLTTSGVSGAAVSGVSGSGSTYTVTVNTGNGNGTIRLDVLNNDSIVDADSSPLSGAFTEGETYAIDKSPFVSSITLANPSPTNLSSVDFTVTFSEDVTGVDISDFTLTTSGVSDATVSGVSGSGDVYTVTVETGNGNGTIRLDVLDDDTILDSESNPLRGGFTEGETYTVDKSPHVLSSLPADPNPTQSSNVNFTVTFSEDVTGVDISDFTLTADNIVDAAISEVNGSGSVYTVTVTTGSGSGTLRLDVVDDDTILDNESNLLSGGFIEGEAYNIDWETPTVLSSVRVDPNPTQAQAVDFTVTFSEPVTGVDIDDFDLTLVGLSDGVILDVIGSGSVYTVTAYPGVGEGTVRLDLLDNDTIEDYVGNKLGGTDLGNGDFINGEAYTTDWPPVALFSVPANPNPTSAESVDFTVTFSEPVTGVDVTDFELTTEGISDASITGINGSGSEYTVTVSTGTGNGTIRLDVVDDDTIADYGGTFTLRGPDFILDGSFANGEAYTIDRDIPVVISSARANPNPTNAMSVDFTVTFSEPVTGVHSDDFDLIMDGSLDANISSISGSGTEYTITVYIDTGIGTLRLDVIDDDTIEDYAGNKLGGTGLDNGNFTSGEIYTVDREFPLVLFSVRNDPSPTDADSVGFTVTFSEPVTGVDVSDFGLTSTVISHASVTAVSGSGSEYLVTVNTGTGNGTLRLDVLSDQTIMDAVGNSTDSDFVSGEVYVIEKEAPTIYTLVLQPNGTDGVDTYLLSGAASSSYGSNTGMGIGEKNSAVGSYARALIKFDLSALPSDAVITSADLSLWTSTDYADNDGTVNVFRLKKPFNETQATWNLAETGVNWQSPGASGVEDRESVAIGSVQISASEAAATEKLISLSPEMIQEMFDGTFANHGFLLATSAELNDRFDFKTSDVGSSLASQRPKLVIQYTSASTNPPPANLLFTDGFESGDFSAWSSSTLGGGDLSVSAAAAMTGANGMQALVNDLTSIYVTDQTPTAEAEFRVRFQLDPNSISIPNNNNFTIASGSDTSGTAWRLTLNYSSGTYKLQGWAMTDAGVWAAGTQIPIQDLTQTVEVEYKSITDAGYLKLWINDTLVDTIANVDNDTMTVGTFYLGAVNGLDTGTSGTIYFDAVETYDAVR